DLYPCWRGAGGCAGNGALGDGKGGRGNREAEVPRSRDRDFREARAIRIGRFAESTTIELHHDRSSPPHTTCQKVTHDLPLPLAIVMPAGQFLKHCPGHRGCDGLSVLEWHHFVARAVHHE